MSEEDKKPCKLILNEDVAAQLSPREIEVVMCLGQGRTLKETGSHLRISPRTADKHRDNIHKELKVTNRADLVVKCFVRLMILWTAG